VQSLRLLCSFCPSTPSTCLQPTSKFAEAYSAGIHKTKYWEPIYEDSLNLIAKLPAIAAHIYRCECSTNALVLWESERAQQVGDPAKR